MTRKHLLLMIIGCTVPIMALAAVHLFQIQIGTLLFLGLFLLCPALHLWLRRSHDRPSTRAPRQNKSQASFDNADGRKGIAIRE